ncbi:MAG: energy transducer TonB [Pseudomonadota bacterium]|nr:energy transducer TonB [Pseudomonadota bacterium]
MSRAWAVSALVVLLHACSSHSTKPVAAAAHEGDASYHALSDDQMQHYQLALGSTSAGAVPIDHPSPSYPSAMLANCPADVRLQAQLIVGTDGKVDEVRVDEAAAAEPAFVSAVRTAAMQWHFEPLIISHWAADAHDETHPVDTEARPFSLPYEFRFACHAGKPVVSSSSTTGK